MVNMQIYGKVFSKSYLLLDYAIKSAKNTILLAKITLKIWFFSVLTATKTAESPISVAPVKR